MSGGAPSNTTSQTTTELPAWAQPYASQLLARGASLSEKDMPVYDGQRTADLNGNQTAGMQMTANRAMNGSGDINAGSNALQSTLGGNYLNHSSGSNGYIGAAPGGTNAFMGENPYLQQTIDKAAGDITRNYTGAVNNTDATMARAGAFGGSAWQQQQEGNSRQLAQSLGDSANAMRMANYTQSANLAENALGRDQQAWQTNAGLTDAGISRAQQGFQAERANQMAGIPLGLAYGNQAYTDAQKLQDAGNTQYGFSQQQLADQQALFNERANAPYKSLDVLGNTIRGAVGGGSTVSQSGPGSNPYAQAAGGAAALYGLLGK